MSFDRPETAAAVRDVVRQIALQAVRQYAPIPRVGRVISVNFGSNTASVWFPGDSAPVDVRMLPSALPGDWQERYDSGGGGDTFTSTYGPGSMVAVENINGTQYITKVLGGGQFATDSEAAGRLDVAYGNKLDPDRILGGEYICNPMWDTLGVTGLTTPLPNDGGPFAISIGPFMSDNSDQPGSGIFEVEIAAGIGQVQRYSFCLNPYYQFSENNLGSIYDRWFRVIPASIDELDKSSVTDASIRTDFSLDVAMRQTVHGAVSSGDVTTSPGELWFRIYLHHLDTTDDLTFVIKVANSGSWGKAKSRKTLKPVYEYSTSPTDAVGYLGYHDSNAAVTTNATQYNAAQKGYWSSGPWRNPNLLLAERAQQVLTGGGIVAWDGTNLKWSSPFEIGGIGRSRHGLSVGKATITMPTTGQIPVLPGGTSVSASASGIPLAAGQSLWFGVPPGVGSTIPVASYFGGGLHGAGGLFIVDSINSSTWWSPPEWAVLIAYRGSDANQPEIKLGTGQTIDKWRTITPQNAWTNRGTGFQIFSCKRVGSELKISGSLKPGTLTGGTIMGTLPTGYIPKNAISINPDIYPSTAGTGTVDVNTDGTIKYWGPTTGVTYCQFSNTVALDL